MKKIPVAGKAPLRLILGIVLLAAIVIGIRFFFHIQQDLKAFWEWIKNLGVWAPFLFTIIYIVVTVLFVPGFILTRGAGILFGVVLGTITVSIAATLGATAAFIVGRYFARDWVEQKVRSRKKMREAFINDPEHNRLQGNTLFVSSIYKWYSEDFKDDIVGFFMKYAGRELRKRLKNNPKEIKVEFLDYDWSLNGK